MSNQQPSAKQILEARFEAVKVVLAVAERILLTDYERNIIIQSALLAAKGLQEEYQRETEASDEAPVEDDSTDSTDSTDEDEE